MDELDVLTDGVAGFDLVTANGLKVVVDFDDAAAKPIPDIKPVNATDAATVVHFIFDPRFE